jgi:hypothetical protein
MAGMEDEMRTCTCPLSHQIAGVCPKLRLLAEFRELQPFLVPSFLTMSDLPVPACTENEAGTKFTCTCEPFHYSVLATCPKRKPELLGDPNYGPKCRKQDYNKKMLAQPLTPAAKSVAAYTTAMTARDFVRTILEGARLLEAKEAAEVLTAKSVIDWDPTRRAKAEQSETFVLNFPVTFDQKGKREGSGRDIYVVAAVNKDTYTLRNAASGISRKIPHADAKPHAKVHGTKLISRLRHGHTASFKVARVEERVVTNKRGENVLVKSIVKDTHGDTVYDERSALVYLQYASATVEARKGALTLGKPFDFPAIPNAAPALCGVVTGVVEENDMATYTVSFIWVIAAEGLAEATGFRKMGTYTYQIPSGTVILTNVPDGLVFDGVVYPLLDEKTLEKIPIAETGPVSVGPSTLLHTASSTVTADIAIAIITSDEPDSVLQQGRIDRLRWLADSEPVTRVQYKAKRTKDALRRSAIGVGLELCRDMLEYFKLNQRTALYESVRLLSAKLKVALRAGGMIWDIGREMRGIVRALEVERNEALPLLHLRVKIAADRILEIRAEAKEDVRADISIDLCDSMIAYLDSHLVEGREHAIEEIERLRATVRQGEQEHVTRELLGVVVWLEEQSRIKDHQIPALRELILYAEQKMAQAKPVSFGTAEEKLRFPLKTYDQEITDEVAAMVFGIREEEALLLTRKELKRKYHALALLYHPDKETDHAASEVKNIEFQLIGKANDHLQAQIEARTADANSEFDYDNFAELEADFQLWDDGEGPVLPDSDRIIQSDVELDAIIQGLEADDQRAAAEQVEQAERGEQAPDADHSRTEVTESDIGQNILSEFAQVIVPLLARMHTFFDAGSARTEREEEVSRVMVVKSASAEKPQFLPVGTKFYPVHDGPDRWLEHEVDSSAGASPGFERVALVGDWVYLIRGTKRARKRRSALGIVLEPGEARESTQAKSVSFKRSLAGIRRAEQQRNKKGEERERQRATWLHEHRNTANHELTRVAEEIRKLRDYRQSVDEILAESDTLTEARVARGRAALAKSLDFMAAARAALKGNTNQPAQEAIACDMRLFNTRAALADGLYHSLETRAAEQDREQEEGIQETYLHMLREFETAGFGTKGAKKPRTAGTIVCAVLGLATAGSAESHAELLGALQKTEAGKSVSAVLLPALPFGRALVAAVGAACARRPSRPSFGRSYV